MGGVITLGMREETGNAVPRRTFVRSVGAMALLGAAGAWRGVAAETDARADVKTAKKAFRVAAGEDRDERPFRLGGVTPTVTKVGRGDVGGGLYLFEHRGMRAGGPPEHFHYEQDEWFYAIEGTFGFRVGGEAFTLNAGDMIFLPRRVPHVWALLGDTPGTILGCVTPAGTFEEFFRKMGELTQVPAPEEAAKLFSAHGMKIVGPPYGAV